MRIKDYIRNHFAFSPAAKASIVLMVTQIVQKGLQLLMSPILTRLLSTEEYGQVSVFLSWYEIMFIFTGLGLAKGVFNNGMLDFRKDRDRFTLSLYVLTLVSTVLIGGAVIGFSKFVWNFMGLPLHLLAFLFILQAFESALDMWSMRQRFEYRYKALAVVTISIAVVSPVCGILAILTFPENAVTANIAATRGVFLAVYLGLLCNLIYKARGRIKLTYWKYALKFNLPLIPHYLSLHILNHMDRIQIAAIAGEASAGIYSLAYSGAAVVKLFWTAINASLIPWTYERCERREFKRIDQLTRMLVLGYALICLAVMFLAPEIIHILAPASYHEGIYVIPSVIIGVYYSALYFIFANVVYYYKQPKYVMVGSCCSAVANVALNAIFIPRFGYLVAGYTTAVAYLMQVVIDYYAMRKVAPVKIYKMRYIIGISSLVTGIGIILNFIYGYTVLRYGLLALLLAWMLAYARKNRSAIASIFTRKIGE